jgi:hypothetical protein
MNNIYIENGYQSRKDYLISLSEDFGLDKSIVFSIASMLGSEEDFDGLVSMLEDYEYLGGF